MVGYVWRSCGPEGMNREHPTFPGMNFEMHDGAETDPTMTENMMTKTSMPATPRKSQYTMSTDSEDNDYPNLKFRAGVQPAAAGYN